MKQPRSAASNASDSTTSLASSLPLPLSRPPSSPPLSPALPAAPPPTPTEPTTSPRMPTIPFPHILVAHPLFHTFFDLSDQEEAYGGILLPAPASILRSCHELYQSITSNESTSRELWDAAGEWIETIRQANTISGMSADELSDRQEAARARFRLPLLPLYEDNGQCLLLY